MGQHSEFAKNRITALGVHGSVKSKEMWGVLTNNVNALHGPNFKPPELQQVTFIFILSHRWLQYKLKF